MSLGIGVVGLASYYSKYYAGRAAERAGTDVVAAAHLDATPAQLEALGRDTPSEFRGRYDCPVYDSVEELVADDGVDAVVVGSLLARRAEDVVTALEAGRPVLTGKPAAASATGADRIAAAAAEADLLAATTAPHRHDGRINRARRRVADGGVGDVVHVSASVYHSMASPDGLDAKDGLAPDEPGPAYTMGYYTADLVRWFVDDASPTRIAGELANGNSPFMAHPDLGSATLRFDDGTVADMSFAMCNDRGPGYGWEIEVHGTEGTIRTDQRGHEGVHWHGDDRRIVESFGRTLDPVLDHQFDAFADAVTSGAAPDAVPPGPAEAARGVAICDRWVEAAERETAVTFS